MRYILALILALAAHGAYANCGPTLEIGPDFSITDTTSGSHPGITTDATLTIDFVIPIGKNRNIECEEIEAKTRKYNAEAERTKAEAARKAAEAADEAADAMDQRIRNFDRIISICEKQWIESLCSRLEELGAEIGTQ